MQINNQFVGGLGSFFYQKNEVIRVKFNYLFFEKQISRLFFSGKSKKIVLLRAYSGFILHSGFNL